MKRGGKLYEGGGKSTYGGVGSVLDQGPAKPSLTPISAPPQVVKTTITTIISDKPSTARIQPQPVVSAPKEAVPESITPALEGACCPNCGRGKEGEQTGTGTGRSILFDDSTYVSATTIVEPKELTVREKRKIISDEKRKETLETRKKITQPKPGDKPTTSVPLKTDPDPIELAVTAALEAEQKKTRVKPIIMGIKKTVATTEAGTSMSDDIYVIDPSRGSLELVQVLYTPRMRIHPSYTHTPLIYTYTLHIH